MNVYTGSGFQRIVEIHLDYGATAGALSSQRGVIENSVERLLGSATSESAPYRALQCLTALTVECVYSEDAPGTLWSALMTGQSNSEGMALAYKVLCDAAGIDCVVVEGRLDREEHYWCIITVDGASYHVDPLPHEGNGLRQHLPRERCADVGQLLVGQRGLPRVHRAAELCSAHRERGFAAGR